MTKDTLPLEDEPEAVAVAIEPVTTAAVGVEAAATTATVEVEVAPTTVPAMVPVESAEATLMRELWIVADRVASTEFVPQGLRGKPDKVFAAVLAGREIGLGPMASLKHVSVIDGSPNLSAEATLGLIRKAGHKVEGEATNQSAEVTGTRTDNDQQMTITITLDDALEAGWIDSIDDSNGTRKAIRRSAKDRPLPWELYPAQMLWARAVTTLKTRLFSDVTMGWFTRLEEPAEEI